MKNLLAYVFAAAFFAAATFALVENVRTLGTAHLLLGAIIGGYLLSASLAAPASMKTAREELTAWWTAYRNPTPPAEPPRTGGMGVSG